MCIGPGAEPAPLQVEWDPAVAKESQDPGDATASQIGLQAEEQPLPDAEQLEPEWHDLQTTGMMTNWTSDSDWLQER